MFNDSTQFKLIIGRGKLSADGTEYAQYGSFDQAMSDGSQMIETMNKMGVKGVWAKIVPLNGDSPILDVLLRGPIATRKHKEKTE